jgi:alkylation response protein AidB-like acyl-CoA dehydrogenase
MSNDSLNAFRDSARDYLSRTDQLQRIRALRGTAPGFDRTAWGEIAAAGWTSILVPERHGGLELGLREAAAIAEEIGIHLLPEPFVAGAVQVVSALGICPDSALKEKLLGAIVSGELLAGLAWQEQAAQIEAADIATTAVSNSGQWLLNGTKQFVVPGNGADGWLVSAWIGAKLGLFWVPAATPGVTLTDARRIDGTLMTQLTLDKVSVPTANALAQGDSAQHAIETANDAARIAQSAELLGVARRALELMLDYLKTRAQFGKPIGSFQALQHRSVDAYIQVQLAEACLGEVLDELERGDASMAALAARAKARCAHVAILVTRLAIQFHGAIGFTDECAVGFYFKRALQLAAWLGNAPASRRRYFSLYERAETGAEDDSAATEFPRDADWEAMSEDEFRRIVRGFFMEHYPAHLRFFPRRLRLSEARDWYQTLSRQGWLAPAWPKQFGGMGLPPDKLLAFIEEGERWGVCRVPDMGIIMTGPILIQYGTPEQKAFYLPKIISGEHIWCQGYSEPNAGSDLASLRTEAVIDGDEFVVTGQKIWTTWAHDATHIFMLVRTDKTVKKQEGISFLLVDVKTPGVTIRPIVDIGGNEEFCEVFFDQVRVPRANLVGQLNQGWTVAKSLLGFERIFVGSPKQSQYAFKQLTELAAARGLFDDPVFVSRYSELQLDIADLAAIYTVYADMVKRGEELPPSVSLLKIWATETYARIGMFLAEAADEYGGMKDSVEFDQHKVTVLSPLIISTSATIYGGSSEIQRNILAKAVLGLPG